MTDMPYTIYPEGLYRAIRRVESVGNLLSLQKMVSLMQKMIEELYILSDIFML